MAEDEQARRVTREVFLSSFFGDVRHLGWAMRRLSSRMEDLHLEPGDILYRAADAADQRFLFLVTGEVHLQKEGASDWVFGDRSLIGTLDGLLERPHARTAVATKPSHFLALRGEEWWELLEDSFVMTRRAVLRLSARVGDLRRRPPPLGGFDPLPPAAPAADAPPPSHLVDRILFLRSVPVFARASTQTLVTLAELGETVTVSRGERLFERGAMAGKIAVVAAGDVLATLDGLSGSFGRGMLVGGLGALAAAASCEATTNEGATVIVIAQEGYFDVMEEHFGLARSALRSLALEMETLLDRGQS